MMILNILDQLSQTTKRTEKESILSENRDNEVLQRAFYLAYSPDINFWIKKTKTVNNPEVVIDLMKGMNWMVEFVCSRRFTGKKAITFYGNVLSKMSLDDQEVLNRVISRDLRVGVSVATINKIWRDLIPTYPFMLAETDMKNIVFPAYAQIKMDGCRVSVFREHDDFVIRTRNGSKIECLEILYPYFSDVLDHREMLDGELVCMENGHFISRKRSNGIINKAIKGTISPKEAALIHFFHWDLVDYSSTVPYSVRLQKTETRQNKKVFPVKTFVVNDKKEIDELFKRVLEEGHEGLIIKNRESFWVPKRSFDLVKIKAELTADLLVTGIQPGTGKYESMLGALVAESSDGWVKVNIGTGFSDNLRKEIDESYIGKVVEVKYNERIKKKTSEVDSLFLPRFVKFREDKREANSSYEIF